MYKSRHILLLLLALMLGLGASAQPSTATTQGRDFWLTFLLQYDGPGDRSLLLSGKAGTTVAVGASNGWGDIVVIDVSCVMMLDVPDQQGLVFHVTADDDIAVYARNYIDMTYDIATVYPTQSLGCNYMVQTYDFLEYPRVYCPEVAVVATEDSTQVTVEPRDGTAQTLTLQAGRAAYFYWEEEMAGYVMDGKMSGTRVHSQAGKPIAVFQGSQCAHVGHSACDHLFEQSVPFEFWGRRFIVVPIAGRVWQTVNPAKDVVRILSATTGNHVTINDTTTIILNAGEYIDTSISTAFSIEAWDSVSVCMYMGGGVLEGTNTYVGDPSSIIIPPVEQGAQRSTFAVSNTEMSIFHYANVVSKSCYVPGITLDGIPVDTAFHAFDDTWSYAQLPLEQGTHTLSSEYGTLNAWLYGMGPVESYGYIAAMGLQQPDLHLLVNGVEVTDTADICEGNIAIVELHTGTSFSDTRWLFDGNILSSSSMTLRRYFAESGIYTLQAMLHGDCCQQWCDSLQVTLRVRPDYKMEQADRFCEGTPYPWRDMVLLSAGNYADSLTTVAGCDSVFVLRLEAKNVPQLGIGVETDLAGHTYRLTAQHYDAFDWTTMHWSTVPDYPALQGHEGDTVIDISPTAITYVTLHAEVECPAESTVVLEPMEWPEVIYAPNIFTPGQDDNNRFAILSPLEIDGELTIYNREGLQIFSTADLAEGWDGGNWPQGAYVWHLRYRHLHSPKRWHTAIGTVTLLR